MRIHQGHETANGKHALMNTSVLIPSKSSSTFGASLAVGGKLGESLFTCSFSKSKNSCDLPPEALRGRSAPNCYEMKSIPLVSYWPGPLHGSGDLAATELAASH